MIYRAIGVVIAEIFDNKLLHYYIGRNSECIVFAIQFELTVLPSVQIGGSQRINTIRPNAVCTLAFIVLDGYSRLLAGGGIHMNALDDKRRGKILAGREGVGHARAIHHTRHCSRCAAVELSAHDRYGSIDIPAEGITVPIIFDSGQQSG